MADFGIKPEIALGYQGVKQQPLSDLISTAKGAMEFRRLSELYPEVIRQTKAQATSAEKEAEAKTLTNSLARAGAIARQMGGLLENDLIVQAAKNPESVNKDQLVSTLTQNGMEMSKIAGIDWETQGKMLLQPYITRAMNDPGSVRGYIKQRLIDGLGEQARLVSTFGEPKEVGGQVVQQVPYSDQPLRPIVPPGALPPSATAGAIPGVPQMPPAGQPPVGQPGAQVGGPIPADQTAVAPVAPRGVTSADMTKPIGGPGFQLTYPVRPGLSSIGASAQEQKSAADGEKYKMSLAQGRQTVPAGIRNVDEVLRGAAELEKEINFETGKPADIERAVRQFFGDARYKELSKNIANTQIALAQASGASTDSMRELISRATGDETYPPQVLLKIASRLRGELKGLDMEAQGAQAFSGKFGNANLPAYRDIWARNADTRAFEAMSIMDSRMSKEQREKALDKILPNDPVELREFRNRIRNIQSLSQTGTLPR
jgi:hypothetical protein